MSLFSHRNSRAGISTYLLIVGCIVSFRCLSLSAEERIPLKRRPPYSQDMKAAWFPPASVAPATGWGSVSGRIVWKGDLPIIPAVQVHIDQATFGQFLQDESLVVNHDHRGIANVVIFATPRSDRVHPSFEKRAEEPAVQQVKNGQFFPRMVVMQPGQRLRFSNSQPVMTNYRVDSNESDNINRLVKMDDVVEWKPKKEEFFVRCSSSIYPWMSGYLVVYQSPYVTVTGKDGSFKIENLPAGDLLLTAWHERAGWLPITVTQGGEASRWGKIDSGEELKLDAIPWPAEAFNK